MNLIERLKRWIHRKELAQMEHIRLRREVAISWYFNGWDKHAAANLEGVLRLMQKKEKDL